MSLAGPARELRSTGLAVARLPPQPASASIWIKGNESEYSVRVNGGGSGRWARASTSPPTTDDPPVRINHLFVRLFEMRQGLSRGPVVQN